jgi:two-component system response regulator FlrC
VHAWSERAGGPFVAVNCAALAETLLESELFGHEKGAFTGALDRRRGRIELAEGGTFFLDEIAELKPELQAKLLRVLEQRSFERLGGSRTIPANVRWIAATNRDLRAMLAEGRFRDDLYHRLAVFPVRLPPLRERRRDLLPLAEALLARIARDLGRHPPELTAAARERLLAAPWPGNVRELANALERAVILAGGEALGPEHLVLETPAASPNGDPGLQTLADLERDAVVRTLAAVGGNRKDAAERLGIGLRTLYDKLKRYQLE